MSKQLRLLVIAASKVAFFGSSTSYSIFIRRTILLGSIKTSLRFQGDSKFRFEI